VGEQAPEASMEIDPVPLPPVVLTVPDVEEEEEATTMMPRVGRKELAVEPASIETVEEEVTAPVQPAAVMAAKLEIIRVTLGGGGPVLEAWVPEGANLAVACTWLYGALLPVETDLNGRLVASWRLGTHAGPLPGWQLVSDSEPPLVLHRITNKTKELALRVEVSKEVVRFKASSVVQLGALIGSIGKHQGVDLSGLWVCAGGQAYPHEALVDELPDIELVLKA
jgi:hypothetical protein